MHQHGQPDHGGRRVRVGQAALSKLAQVARAAREQQARAAQEEAVLEAGPQVDHARAEQLVEKPRPVAREGTARQLA